MTTELKINLSFRQYTFEQDKTDCKKCNPGRWLIVANYDLIYFPLRGETYEGIEKETIKVKIASYKNLKDAKRALHKGQLYKTEILIQRVP